MRKINFHYIIGRSLIKERYQAAVDKGTHHIGDLNMLFQFLVNDVCLVYPDSDAVKEMDQSDVMFDFVDQIVGHSDFRPSKDFIIHLGEMGFDNLHYRLVCKYHIAFETHEFRRFQQEARNLMTLIR